MTEATHKYSGEQHERYDGQLQWPGASGFPFMGDAAPSLKQAEVEALPIIGRAHENVFDLNDLEEREYYNWVRDRIRNGLFIKDFESRRQPDDNKWPIIYLEWTQCFVMAPQQPQQAGSTEHGSAAQFTLRRPLNT